MTHLCCWLRTIIDVATPLFNFYIDNITYFRKFKFPRKFPEKIVENFRKKCEKLLIKLQIELQDNFGKNFRNKCGNN